jgi:hypothetical protein
MQLVERIEKRRFIGRELLLFLWFESEMFEATLSTKEHGDFGFWIEKEILLSSGKETTRIKGGTPAHAREAKEALRLGKLPERATFHLSLGEREATFSIKAEPLALAGLKLPTVLDKGGDEPAPGELGAPKGGRPKMRRTSVEQDREAESDARNEAFYERMVLTREVEVLIEALYRDFLVLRLGPAWEATVMPALRAWAAGEEVDAERYRAARTRAQKGTKASGNVGEQRRGRTGS